MQRGRNFSCHINKGLRHLILGVSLLLTQVSEAALNAEFMIHIADVLRERRGEAEQARVWAKDVKMYGKIYGKIREYLKARAEISPDDIRNFFLELGYTERIVYSIRRIAGIFPRRRITMILGITDARYFFLTEFVERRIRWA